MECVLQVAKNREPAAKAWRSRRHASTFFMRYEVRCLRWIILHQAKNLGIRVFGVVRRAIVGPATGELRSHFFCLTCTVSRFSFVGLGGNSMSKSSVGPIRTIRFMRSAVTPVKTFHTEEVTHRLPHPSLPLPTNHLRNRPQIPLKHGIAPSVSLRQRKHLRLDIGCQM